jgi:hypothetical protein
MTMVAPPLHAQPKAPDQGAGGAAALSRAREAWATGDYDIAGPQYVGAIDGGGLSPEDLLDAYVHLGVSEVVAKEPKAAAEAFRHAALIDPAFTVPPEAGKRAQQLAAAARRAAMQTGPLALSANVPSAAPSGHAIGIDATVDAPHLAVVSKMGILARDPLTSHSYAHSEVAAPSVHFEVPSNLTLPDATLVVRVDALDANDNRLASVEQRIHIAGAAPRAGAAEPKAKAAAHDRTGDTTKEKETAGGFWSTAWPWVIGGTLLAAGGAAGYYFGLRPTDDVNVGAVRVH